MGFAVDFFPEDTEGVLELETFKKLLNKVHTQRGKWIFPEFGQ